jgi:uncharacterized protein (TIGR00251 family)
MTADWLGSTDDGVRLTIRVQPRASRTEVVGPHGEALKIRLAAPPVDGAANRELVAFLAKRLRRPKSAITITGGEHARIKTVMVENAEAREVRAILFPESPG